MTPVEVKAGDAILFTENLRHGGVPNLSGQVRKTLHVGYGPFWLKSQNIATIDQDPCAGNWLHPSVPTPLPKSQ